ncbi:MAG: hypothetical protein B6I30_07265 [Desulfobacteraceae bacterium 4572_187]|nr:MAG: hypothetical protein B6I30_07265 [Desulfobacteraceae bacterium 4572_187]
MARFYRESGALVFFEPNNLKHSEKLEEAIRLCHVLKYAGAETKKDIAEDNTDEFIKRIKSYCPPLVIKTLGKYGLLYRFAGDTKWKYQKGVKPDEIFDSCGAGDWCTASFIFYINELAQQNNLKLLDILKHNEFIRQSFSFAQILASISLRFVGARGLSNSMTKEDLFKNYQSYFNGSCETIFFTGRSKQKSKRMEVYNTKIKHKSAGCSTCLLNDKS